MQFSIIFDNIKCRGCANQIISQLVLLEGVSSVAVQIDEGEVTWVSEESTVDRVKSKMASMGYPEIGSMAGVKAMGAKAKSYVSCAIGKMSD